MAPDITIVLVVGKRRNRAARALASLLAQRPIANLEVLLLDCAPPGAAPPIPGSDDPAVRRVQLPPATLFGAAKASGVRMAAAPVVAFLEEHCEVAPGWAAALLAAHRGPWAGVGAEVHERIDGECADNASAGDAGRPYRIHGPGAAGRIVALMNYHPWLPPAPRAEHDMLPGNNASFKRDLLLAYGDRLDDLLRAEIVLHTRMRRDGHRLLLEPDAKFAHLNEARLASACRGFYLFHRLYGPSRAREFGWTSARRLFYVAATPAIPLYFLVRLLLVLARRRPRLLGAALAASPWMLAAQLAAATGQAAGLLFGIGAADARMTDYELNQPRDERDEHDS
jgi:GT2 family glycosyltransferase